MATKRNVILGKFISKILRHQPGLIGISLDEHGWADVQDLIAGVRAAGHPDFDMAVLEEIVETNNKKRYSFSDDKQLIRANQGHSIPVDVELPVTSPPATLCEQALCSPFPGYGNCVEGGTPPWKTCDSAY